MIHAINNAQVTAFEVAQEQVDFSSRPAPLSLILLSVNRLNGYLPVISVQGLPHFVKRRNAENEEWEWQIKRIPEAAIIPSPLQFSPLKTSALVNLSCSNGSLQNDLFQPGTKLVPHQCFAILQATILSGQFMAAA